MKRCRTCNRTYTDANLSYCIDDGTPLTTDVPEDEATVVTPPSSSDDGRSVNDDWNAAAYRPPSNYVPPGAMPPGKRRRAWVWAVGVLGAFLLGAIALSIAAAILLPRLIRSEADRIIVGNSNENWSETSSTENVDAPAPTDEVQVLAQLTDIENEWTVANLNADKKKLDRILADDYVGPRPPPQGGLLGKKEYIETIQRDNTVEKWEFSDLKLQLSGDRATLTGKIKYYLVRQPEAAFTFTDKFVWRDGRWQATGSEITPTQ